MLSNSNQQSVSVQDCIMMTVSARRQLPELSLENEAKSSMTDVFIINHGINPFNEQRAWWDRRLFYHFQHRNFPGSLPPGMPAPPFSSWVI
jgi:hypothetical protein